MFISVKFLFSQRCCSKFKKLPRQANLSTLEVFKNVVFHDPRSKKTNKFICPFFACSPSPNVEDIGVSETGQYKSRMPHATCLPFVCACGWTEPSRIDHGQRCCVKIVVTIKGLSRSTLSENDPKVAPIGGSFFLLLPLLFGFFSVQYINNDKSKKKT